MSRVSLLAIAALAGLALSASSADVVYTKDGQEIDGWITWRGKSGVSIQRGKEAVFVSAEQIGMIETHEQMIERIRAESEAAAFAQRMEAEGKVFYKDQWVPREQMAAEEAKIAAAEQARIAALEEAERKKAEADKEFAERMQQEGKTLYKGRWLTEEEKAAAEEKAKAAAERAAEERKERAAEAARTASLKKIQDDKKSGGASRAPKNKDKPEKSKKK